MKALISGIGLEVEFLSPSSIFAFGGVRGGTHDVGSRQCSMMARPANLLICKDKRMPYAQWTLPGTKPSQQAFILEIDGWNTLLA